MSDNLFAARTLAVDYVDRHGGVTHAVTDASLSIRRGEAVALVGESGSGKSSVALAVAGLLPDRVGVVSGGHALLDGRDMARFSEAEWREARRHRVRMIFQDPMSHLNPIMTVGQQIAEGMWDLKTAAERSREVARLLEAVQLDTSVKSAYPHELSGGMRQRALIAIALAGDPDLIIADEPTTALDVTTQAEILALLRDLMRNKRVALLLVTHDVGVVEEVCDRLYVMYAGKTVESGQVADLVTGGRPRHPYTQGLVNAANLHKTHGEFDTVPGEVSPNHVNREGCVFAPRCHLAVPICWGRMPPWTSGETGQVRCWVNGF